MRIHFNIKQSAIISLNYHSSAQFPEHTDVFVPTFSKLTTTEISPSHSQPLTSSHFHQLIIVEMATYRLLLQRPQMHSSTSCLRTEMMHQYLTACQDADFYRDGIFELVSRWVKCINELADYVGKIMTIKSNKSPTFNIVIMYHLILMTYGNLLTEDYSYIKDLLP
jgi:hypothetical protein